MQSDCMEWLRGLLSEQQGLSTADLGQVDRLKVEMHRELEGLSEVEIQGLRRATMR